MPNLKSILKPMGTLLVPFNDESVSVTYRPQYLTPEFEEKLKTLNTEEKATEAFLELFCSVVVSWDLKAEEGDAEPIPITKEALRPVPYDILGEVLNRVQEAVVPNPTTESNSEGTSLLPGGSVPFPNGMD